MVELVSTVKEDKEQKYNLYHNFRQDLSRISSYQYLAISRGEKEKALRVSFAFRGSSNPSSTKSNDGISDMLDRVLEDCNCGIDIAIAWSVTTKNSLQNIHNYKKGLRR